MRVQAAAAPAERGKRQRRGEEEEENVTTTRDLNAPRRKARGEDAVTQPSRNVLVADVRDDLVAIGWAAGRSLEKRRCVQRPTTAASSDLTV
ncbi:hypothetical protein MRX96_002669 [Rhipicephalus microplus]